MKTTYKEVGEILECNPDTVRKYFSSFRLSCYVLKRGEILFNEYVANDLFNYLKRLKQTSATQRIISNLARYVKAEKSV